MSSIRFIDTNLLLRYITNDHAEHSPRAQELFLRIAAGEFEGLLSMTVLFETVYVLEGLKGLGRQQIAQNLRIVAKTPGIRLLNDDGNHLTQTLELYASFPRLSLADCYHAVLSQMYCDGEIYTFDRDFDRVPDLIRLEP